MNVGAMVNQRAMHLEQAIMGYKKYIKQLESDLELNSESLAHAQALSCHVSMLNSIYSSLDFVTVDLLTKLEIINIYFCISSMKAKPSSCSLL